MTTPEPVFAEWAELGGSGSCDPSHAQEVGDKRQVLRRLYYLNLLLVDSGSASCSPALAATRVTLA